MSEKVKPVCTFCESDNVKVDSFSTWDVKLQAFVHLAEFDAWVCEKCGDECSVTFAKLVEPDANDETITKADDQTVGSAVTYLRNRYARREKRINNAIKALEIATDFAIDGDSVHDRCETYTGDMIANLAELCTFFAVDFDKCIKRGLKHFQDEIEETETPNT